MFTALVGVYGISRTLFTALVGVYGISRTLFTALVALVFVETETENATRHDHSQSEDPSRLTSLWGGTFSQCDAGDMLNKDHNIMSYTVTPGQNKQTDKRQEDCGKHTYWYTSNSCCILSHYWSRWPNKPIGYQSKTQIKQTDRHMTPFIQSFPYRAKAQVQYTRDIRYTVGIIFRTNL